MKGMGPSKSLIPGKVIGKGQFLKRDGGPSRERSGLWGRRRHSLTFETQIIIHHGISGMPAIEATISSLLTGLRDKYGKWIEGEGFTLSTQRQWVSNLPHDD
jgi:hypothetical protein